jgi:hypothetical protein
MLTPTANWTKANAKFEKQVIYRFTIGGYYRTFSNLAPVGGPNAETDDPWLVSIDDHTKNVNDLEGGADQETMCFTVQDRSQKITKDFGAGYIFEGKLVQLYVGFASLTSLTDYLLLWQGYVDQVDSLNSNSEYYFQCSDVTSKLQQVVYQTGDTGAPTSANDIKTIKGHPLDIMLDILLNQLKDPASGQSLDPALINVARIQAYRNGVFAGAQMLFHLTQAPQAFDFIKNQLLKPLCGYIWVSQGKITVNFPYPLVSPTSAQTLTPDDWLTIPEAEQTAMVNTVQFQFDKDDASQAGTGNYLNISTQEYGASIALYGLFGEHSIASDGMRSALQGYLLSWLVARLIFLRYGFKNLKFDKNASEGLFTQLLLEPGDLVSVTHPQIPDRKAGVMGVTNKLFEVLGKKIEFGPGLVTMTMIDASYLKNYGFSEVTSDTESDYTSASPSDQATFMFMCGTNGKYSNGNAGNTLG